MATVEFFDAFEYKWAQTGGNFDWQDDQYKLGWATVGSTPPTVEQFNRVLQISDEKSNWLFEQLKTVADAKSVTLSAADLTGLQQVLDAYVPEAASETVAGIIELATSAEVQAGADTTRAVTPAGLASLTSTDTRRGLVELATTAETTAGTDTTRAVTPGGLAAQFPIRGHRVYNTAGAFTWTVPIGVSRVRVTLVGGGGGGGGAFASGGSGATGGGGGGGSWGCKLIDLAGATSVSGVVGAGGVGGISNTSPSTAGSASSFGAFLSASGGLGGNFGSNGPGPGGSGGATVTGADYGGVGAGGAFGTIRDGVYAAAGIGGPSHFGGNSSSPNVTGSSASFQNGGGGNNGSGGSGGAAYNATASGGAGGNGLVLIEW